MGDSREDSFTAFFRVATGGFTPYGWQLQVAVDGLPDVLPVPTGLGKTEVALAWAWRLLVDKNPEPLHLVICLPMRSLVSQTVQRLVGYFDALRANKPEIDIGVHQLMGGAIGEQWVLARRYVEKDIFSILMLNDAIDVAAAVVTDQDILLSWNFKHLVNRRRRAEVNALNAASGLRTIEILSPSEI